MTQTTTAFLSEFMFSGGLMQVSIGLGDNGIDYYAPEPPVFQDAAPQDTDVYFSPALRRREGSNKRDVLGSKVAWCDVDDLVLPTPTYPASGIVSSGHGWHLYWFLRAPVLNGQTIEWINKVAIADIPTADQACWNRNRLMRVPGTWNVPDLDKDETEPVECTIHETTGARYDAVDFDVLHVLDDTIRHRIRTGEVGPYSSRSERDYSVIRALLVAGATDTLITTVFTYADIGDKYRDHGTPSQYLSYSIMKLRQELGIGITLAGDGASDNELEEAIEEGGLSDGDSDDIDVDALDSILSPEPQTNPPKLKASPTPTLSSKASKAPTDKRKNNGPAPVSLVEKSDGYYMQGTSSRRISTFTLDPIVLLDGSHFDADDALVCNVHANEGMWANVTFSRKAFTSLAQLDRSCPLLSWQWLGTDADVRQLLPFLLAKLREHDNGKLRRIAASPATGYHFINGVPMFLGDTSTLTPEAHYEGSAGPLTWLPTGREHPKIEFGDGITEEELDTVKTYLPRLNDVGTIWPMIGWYAATCLKPWLESMGYRFPILNVTGTKGSGKTTLTQRILMPLFGQTDAKGYDAGTTKFVMLSLLGSTNAIPLAFSEFRYDAVEKFIRTVLMSYDSGHDPRGRADQTTQDYALSAPFSIDGEDVIADPAARERSVVARLKPGSISEGSDAYMAFAHLRKRIPKGFGGFHIQHALIDVATGYATQMLEQAHADVFAEFTTSLPDRVRNNYTVVRFGTLLYCRNIGVEPPPTSVLRDSVGEVVNIDSGQSRTLIDEFVEAVVSAVAQSHNVFKYKYIGSKNVLYFQLSAAHSWWLSQRRRQGRGALERDAMLAQLKEATYGVAATRVDDTWMQGIHLGKAQEYGLDVVSKLSSRTITLAL